MIFPPLMLASVARPVEDKVETVEAKAFKLPVDDNDEPVIAPAFTPAIVDNPATPRVPEAVRLVTVEAPEFKARNDPRVVADRVVPVIFVEVMFAKVARSVLERVLTVVAKAFKAPVEDKDDPVTAPALTPASVDVPATPKVDEAVREVTVAAPLFKEAKEDRPLEDRVVPVILVEVMLAKVDNPVPERVVRVTLAS